jgi:hypothetical protein
MIPPTPLRTARASQPREHQIGLRRPTPPALTNTARPDPPNHLQKSVFLFQASAKIQPFSRIGPNHAGLRGAAARSLRIVSVSSRRNTPRKPRGTHTPAGHWHSVAEEEETLSCQGSNRRGLFSCSCVSGGGLGKAASGWRRGECGISEARGRNIGKFLIN